MALVATKDQFVEDIHGVRRLVKGGQQVPAGLFNPGDVEAEEVSVRTLATPIVDKDASQPSGTAAEPDAGISLETSQQLQADARQQGSRSGSRRAKPESGSGS